MKRKIYRTKYGRLMLKIQTQHRNNYQSIFVLNIPNSHFEASGTVKSINTTWQFKFPNRSKQDRIFKALTQERAEMVAESLMDAIPDIFKKGHLK